MKRIAWAMGAVLVTSGIAVAECPGHVASLPGVKLTRTAPYAANIYRQTTEGLTEMAAPDTAAAAEGVVEIYPHPLVSGRRIAPNGELALAYDADPAELEALETTGVWRSGASLVLNGRTILEGEIERRLAGTEMVTIGDCATRVWLVEVRMTMGEGDGSWTMLSYAPALGLVVRSVTLSAKGETLQDFAYDTIEVLAR